MNHHHGSAHPRRDPHQILGVAPGATQTQINAAYRRALRRLHPDTSRYTCPDTGQDAGDTTAPGRGNDPAPELTLADLQHARRELLRAARRPAESAFGRPRRPTTGQPDILAGPVRYQPPPPPG